MTSNIRGSSIYSPKSLYKKTSQEILGELKAAFKTGESKVPRPQPVLPSLIWQAYANSQLLPTPPTPPRGREKKNVTKMNFSSCSDHSPKWIINDCYIFFPYLRVWVFLFSADFFLYSTTRWSYVTILLFNTDYYIQNYSLICTQSNGFKYFYLTLITIFNIDHLSTDSKVVISIATEH